MYLNRKIAGEIIKEISPFLNFDLNIMSDTGLILASTDPSRENTHHEGAKILINENRDSLIVDYDDTFPGCRQGVNLPIYFADQVIGVFGITGKPEEVIKYGRIVQKMTEMLVYENFNLVKRANKENLNLLLMNDLLHDNLHGTLFNIEERLLQANLNVNGPFTVSLFYPLLKEDDPSSDNQYTLVEKTIIKNYIVDFMEKQRVLCAYNGEFYMTLSNYKIEKLIPLLEILQKTIRDNYKMSLIFFTGNEYNNYLDIPKAFKEALSVRQHLKAPYPGIFQFNSIVLGFILNQIPTIHRNNIYSQIFKNCTPAEIHDFSHFIVTYFQCNGSLNKMAELHFAHKNTIQYKINKIAKKTGLDLRIYSDLFVLYLASTDN